MEIYRASMAMNRIAMYKSSNHESKARRKTVRSGVEGGGVGWGEQRNINYKNNK